MPTLEGVLERITYRSETDGYTVARLRRQGRAGLITIVGKLLGVQVGESLELEGRWVDHPEHGRQFEIERWRSLLPATVEGVQRYLGSGLVKGIGPATAKRITETFGSYTLDVLEHTPERLAEVPGLGRRKAEQITRAWQEQRQIKHVMLFLQDLDIAPSLAIRIYRQYGDSALELIQSNPYRLADEIDGIGFVTADSIANGLGIPNDSPLRLAAGLRYTLARAADDGHCYLPRRELIDNASRLLACEAVALEATLDAILITREVRAEAWDGDQQIYLWPFLRAERGVAERIRDLLREPSVLIPFFRQVNWPLIFERLATRRNIDLSAKQREAVQTALTSKVTALTGGPGTGKTTTLKTVILALEQRGYRYKLTAPTGRAAKRLSEATGAEATTIHRLLEYSPIEGGSFKRNADRPLECDLVIVDEVSMLDVLLANQLLKAIPPEAHLLLVGDSDQLPSVGPGRVLRDLLDSMAISSVHLDLIFRQAEGSGIIANAHRINAGQSPQFDALDDFFFFPQAEPERCAELVVDLVVRRIPRRFGLDPRQAIQVLSPMHKGAAGVSNLNLLLQEALNPAAPHKPEQRYGVQTFRIGDRVLQQRNNYDLDVYNGDIGEIVALDLHEETLSVRFDDTRQVVYRIDQLDELTLAYAISVHKAQGAEYSCIVIPLLMQHYNLLQRNLIYTGVTRAKQLVVLVGDRRALEVAVAQHDVAGRYSGLARRLVGGE